MSFVTNRTFRADVAFCLTLCMLGIPASEAVAHNGAVAVAHPVQGITIDGDLADWPAEMPTYPIASFEYGDKPEGDDDLSARFRVGYNVDEHALYVAIEATDQSTVIDNSSNSSWDSQDGCELYIDAVHAKDGSAVAQYCRFGDRNQLYGTGDLKDVKVAFARSGPKRFYEWRVDLGSELIAGRSLGFDVSVIDMDGDGSFSWAAWGPGTQKLQSGSRCGDVLLLDPGTPFGDLAGEIEWRKESEKPLPRLVRIQSRQVPKLWVGATVDPKGAYKASLPAGSYSIHAVDTFEVRIDDSSGVDVEVEANGHAKADPLKVAPLPKPGLIGETGVLHRFESVDPKEIDRFIQAYMKYYKIPGISIALLKDGKIVYRRAFGVKNSATGEKVDDNTVFGAASMTKVVFAYAVNRLVERGVLDLDTPLHTYLPFEAVADDDRYKQITARMVLSHSTGFPNWFSGKPKINFDPGAKFGYSGIGFVYLGNVVAHLTGKKLVDLIEEEVFAPLGIRDASLVWNDRIAELASRAHSDGGAPLTQSRPGSPNVAASLHISATNYAKFLAALMQGKDLSKSTFREMLRPQNNVPREDWGLKPNENASYGLGILVAEAPFGTWYAHGGSNPGFTSDFELHNDLSLGYVFLVNNQQANNLNEDLRAYLITGKGGAEAAAGE